MDHFHKKHGEGLRWWLDGKESTCPRTGPDSEDPTCCGAAKTTAAVLHHGYRAQTPEPTSGSY